MLLHVSQFYGGPLCGKKWELHKPMPRGVRWPSVGGDPFYYIHDGAGRYVYTQTLEGTFILAEIEENKRRAK